MNDGSVVISILGDRKHIAKELESTRKDIEKTEKKLAERVSEKTGIETQMEEAMKAAKATSDKIRSLQREHRELSRIMADDKTSSSEYARAARRQAEITKELQIQRPILKAQDADANRLRSRYESASAEVERLTRDLEAAKARAKDLANQDNQAKVGEAVRKQLDKVTASAERFRRRMLRIGRNVLFYSLITRALRSAVSYFGTILKTNKELSSQLAKLKGSLLTAFQPLTEKIIPWVTSLLRILTSVFHVVGNLLSLLFGGTLLGSAKSAEAMNKQAKAISAVGSAAKEAGKQLASFDQINKLSSDKDSGGGGGSSGISPDFSDFDKFKSEEYQRELNRLTAILSGALLALGAILFFSGASIMLGLGLMAAGAIGLASFATGRWGEVTDELRKTLTKIFLLLAGAFLVIGAILAFSGTGPLNIARGIAMMAIGAAALVGAAYVNWEYIPTELKDAAVAICVVGGYVCLAVGIALLFLGHPAIGAGLILSSVALLGGAIAISWTYMPEQLTEIATEICVVGGAIMLAVGIALLFASPIPHHKGIGIGLIAASAGLLGTAVAINWDSWQGPILNTVDAICNYGGAVLIAIGAILLFSGANIPLGIGLIVGGIAARKLAEEIPWNSEAGTKDLLDTLDMITATSGALLTSIGLILLFSGAGIPLGLGLLAAGAAMLWSSYSTDYDDSGIGKKILSTEERLAQSATIKSAVNQASTGDVSAGQLVRDVMSAYDEMGMTGDMLYEYLSQDVGLEDDDIESLGFVIGRNGAEAYITGIADGAANSSKDIGTIISGNLITSIDDLWCDVMFEGKDPVEAQNEMNQRIVSILKSGLLTPDQIKEVFDREDVQAELSDLGLNFADGYVQGMEDGDADIEREARELTERALNAIAEAQDSHSPSKKTAELGKDAVDGYVNGIADNAATIETAGETMIASLTNGMTSKLSMLDAVLKHIVDSANAMVNAVVSAAHSAAEAMSSMSYSGGTIRIPTPTLRALSIPDIPRLATGAVIPPNAPYLAVVGDQRKGVNVESPLSTIQEAVAGVLRGEDLLDAMREQNRLLQRILEKSGDVKLDGRSVTESVNSYQRQMSRAYGGDGYGSI